MATQINSFASSVWSLFTCHFCTTRYWLFAQTKHSPDMFSHWHVPWFVNSCPASMISMPTGDGHAKRWESWFPFQRVKSLVHLYASKWRYLASMVNGKDESGYFEVQVLVVQYLYYHHIECWPRCTSILILLRSTESLLGQTAWLGIRTINYTLLCQSNKGCVGCVLFFSPNM